MLVNKHHFEEIGLLPVRASLYVRMLYRCCPSVSVETKYPRKGRIYGPTPTKHFDLDYALEVARGYATSSDHKVRTDQWTELCEALDKIKLKEKQ